MLLEDAKKAYPAQYKTTVKGIATTKDGIKEVNVSLGEDGLAIKEVKPEKKNKTGRPRKEKKNK